MLHTTNPLTFHTSSFIYLSHIRFCLNRRPRARGSAKMRTFRRIRRLLSWKTDVSMFILLSSRITSETPHEDTLEATANTFKFTMRRKL